MAFTQEQVTYLIKTYSGAGSIRKTQKKFKEDYGIFPSDKKISQTLKENGVTLDSRGGRRNFFDEAAFRELYKDCNGNLARMGVRSGKERKYLESRCKSLGLLIDP